MEAAPRCLLAGLVTTTLLLVNVWSYSLTKSCSVCKGSVREGYCISRCANDSCWCDDFGRVDAGQKCSQYIWGQPYQIQFGCKKDDISEYPAFEYSCIDVGNDTCYDYTVVAKLIALQATLSWLDADKYCHSIGYSGLVTIEKKGFGEFLSEQLQPATLYEDKDDALRNTWISGRGRRDGRQAQLGSNASGQCVVLDRADNYTVWHPRRCNSTDVNSFLCGKETTRNSLTTVPLTSAINERTLDITNSYYETKTIPVNEISPNPAGTASPQSQKFRLTTEWTNEWTTGETNVTKILKSGEVKPGGPPEETVYLLSIGCVFAVIVLATLLLVCLHFKGRHSRKWTITSSNTQIMYRIP